MGTMTLVGRVSIGFWGSTAAHLLCNLSSSTVLTWAPVLCRPLPVCAAGLVTKAAGTQVGSVELGLPSTGFMLLITAASSWSTTLTWCHS